VVRTLDGTEVAGRARLDELADAKVQLTMVAGATVFVDPSFS